MAISPPGDIVLDVMRAAAPQKVEAARQKLQAKAAGADFDIPLSRPGRADMRAGNPAPAKPPEAFVQFEALVLQSFLDSMLPKEMEDIYGGGLSGEMWRSVLTQHLGETLAKGGGIGIAEQVLGDHYVEDDRKIPVAGVSSGPEHEEAAIQASLSSAMLQEIERRTTENLSADGPANSSTERE